MLLIKFTSTGWISHKIMNIFVSFVIFHLLCNFYILIQVILMFTEVILKYRDVSSYV
jgi:hypothetical protein